MKVKIDLRWILVIGGLVFSYILISSDLKDLSEGNLIGLHILMGIVEYILVKSLLYKKNQQAFVLGLAAILFGLAAAFTCVALVGGIFASPELAGYQLITSFGGGLAAIALSTGYLISMMEE